MRALLCALALVGLSSSASAAILTFGAIFSSPTAPAAPLPLVVQLRNGETGQVAEGRVTATNYSETPQTFRIDATNAVAAGIPDWNAFRQLPNQEAWQSYRWGWGNPPTLSGNPLRTLPATQDPWRMDSFLIDHIDLVLEKYSAAGSHPIALRVGITGEFQGIPEPGSTVLLLALPAIMRIARSRDPRWRM